MLVAGLLALGGCATTPQVLRGDFYAPISPNQAALEHRTGAYVRWGGQILSVQHEKSKTCFDVLGRPLDRRAKPAATDQMDGRYRACAPGFYDPEIYAVGRSITTTGLVERETTKNFDSYELRVPVVAAEVVYLWPQTRYYAAAYPMYGPYWGWPYGYGWGPYYGFGYGFGPWFGGGFYRPWGYGYRYAGYGYKARTPYRYGYGRGGGMRSPGVSRPVRGPSRGGGGGGGRVPVRGR